MFSRHGSQGSRRHSMAVCSWKDSHVCLGMGSLNSCLLHPMRCCDMDGLHIDFACPPNASLLLHGLRCAITGACVCNCVLLFCRRSVICCVCGASCLFVSWDRCDNDGKQLTCLLCVCVRTSTGSLSLASLYFLAYCVLIVLFIAFHFKQC